MCFGCSKEPSHRVGSFEYHNISVLDLGLISIASLGPRASTKVESHVNFTESQKVSQPIFFAILNTEKIGKTIN